MKFRFTTDGEGNYGYLGADDSFVPFLSDMTITVGLNGTNPNIRVNTPFIYENNKKYKKLKIIYSGYMNCEVKGDSTILYTREDGSYVSGITTVHDISNCSKITVSGSNSGYTDAEITLTFFNF